MDDLVIIPILPVYASNKPLPVPYEILYRYLKVIAPFYLSHAQRMTKGYKYITEVEPLVREIQEVKFLIQSYCKEHSLEYYEQPMIQALHFIERHYQEVLIKLESGTGYAFLYFSIMKLPISFEQAIRLVPT